MAGRSAPAADRRLMLRAIGAFLALPGVVACAVPLLLAWPDAGDPPFHALGLLPLVPGIGLLLWCVREFATAGGGTLAPWDPPRHLVTSGPYRFSRNPMYAAVGLVLAGWAIGFGSALLALYAAAIVVAFHVRVVRYEEPQLARAFRDDWKRYASRVPRWVLRPRRDVQSPPVRWSAGRIAIAGVAIIGLVAIAGLLYEAFAEARDARAFPPPGTLVDVGGRRLHLICIGEGEPLVLFESSGWGTSLSAAAARERIASRTRVCSYDRRGRGWSDPAPGAATSADLASDLGVLQDRAALPGPFVIVASSIGGLTAEMFARQYPERVAGLVFVDAASSLSLPLLASHSGRLSATMCGGSVLAHVGVVRLLNPFELGDDTEDGRRNAALSYNARTWSHLCALARGIDDSQRAFADAPPLPDVPIVVLSASSAEGLLPPGFEQRAKDVWPAFLETHRQLAEQAATGTWRMVPESSHLIGESQPDAIVEAVFELLADVRSRRLRAAR